jgi:RNA polymerase sigma-70 factor, ECF subfamily
MADAEEARNAGDVTALLREAAAGDREAFDRLLPLIYDELKRVARVRRRYERADHTLSTTGLVHEAYIRLVGQNRIEWQNSAQFFAVASQAMRRILIDYAKQRHAVRRGGSADRLSLDEASDLPALQELFSDAQVVELIALDDALRRLESFNPPGAQVVQYRFFGGLSLEEAGRLMGTSERTARRTWTVAKAWLRRELEVGGGAATLLESSPRPQA